MPVSVWSMTPKQCGVFRRAYIGREHRLDQFQVANSHRVEHHGIGAIVSTWDGPDDRARLAACRGGSAVLRRRRRPPARGPASPQPSKVRRKCSRKLRSRRNPSRRPRHPGWSAGRSVRGKRGVRGAQHFAGAELLDRGRQLFAHPFPWRETRRWRYRRGRPRLVRLWQHGGEVVILMRAAAARRSVAVPGVTIARHLALHQLLGEAGIFHLVADGNAIAAAGSGARCSLPRHDRARRTSGSARPFPCCAK